MINCTTKYVLTKNGQSIEFNSEWEACKYLGVTKCTIASCYRKNSKCKGYSIKRIGTTTHHMSKTRLFKIWDAMKDRCYRTRHFYYKHYGGRGIKVCSEWKDSFNTFYHWAIDNGYSDNLTLDRIDVNGNYEPNNCRWITIKEQFSNKRNNHFIMLNGVKMTITQCSEIYKIPKSTLTWRDNHHRDLITGEKLEEKENAD